MNRSRHLAVVLLAATVAAAAVTAQQPAAAAAPLPPLLLGHRVLRGADFATERELPPRPHSTAAEWRVDGSWRLDGGLLDLTRGERFVFGKDSVSRLQLDGSVVWSAPTVSGIDFDDRALAAAQLKGARLLLRGRGGGVVALDRATGREAWHLEDAVNSVLAADHELVCGGGSVGAAGRLWACAIGNGARAFEVDLPGPPEQIVLAPFGIAVRLAAAVVVFDRAGPRLGGLDGPARTVLAGPDGWFVAVPEAVVSCARDGRERWRTPRSPLGFEQEQVVSDGGGRLLLVRACTIADDGAEVTCLDADDGTVVWTTTLPGLGVTHSKYIQRVAAFVSGGHLVVLSQASGGDFAEQVALDDGARGRRVQFSR